MVDEAASKNLKIIGPSAKKHITKSSNWRSYQFLECGHKQDITLQNVRRGQFICEICRVELIKKDAAKLGLILIKTFFKKDADKRIGRAWGEYKFKKCGHLKTERIDVIQNEMIRCDTCLDIKHKREAKKAGLLFLGEAKENHGGASKTSNWRSYQFIKCAHIRDITLQNVRKNSFVCNSCFDTFLELPSNLYLLSLKVGSFEWLKFGYSKNVTSRIEQYGLSKKTKIKKIKIIKFKTGREALNAESVINKNNNLYKLSFHKMKHYHKKSGYTECYPIEMKDKLLKELANLGNK